MLENQDAWLEEGGGAGREGGVRGRQGHHPGLQIQLQVETELLWSIQGVSESLPNQLFLDASPFTSITDSLTNFTFWVSYHSDSIVIYASTENL